MLQQKQRAVLVGAHLGLKDTLADTTESSIQELKLLAKTAGVDVNEIFIQNRQKLETGTYIGEGKITEIADFIAENNIELAIFDDELSGIQTRNLSDLLKVPIVDRSTLILDIFAQRAQSNEGQLQVELAQLRYLLPRLAGSSAEAGLSRAGVGVGARGPGETKLETDRRHIKEKISALNEQLQKVENIRETQRRARVKDGIQQIALIGYTNAGKSTLLNTLTNSDIFAQDLLFATLDPTTRKMELPDGATVLLTDTVGFIRKLPHHLIRAFRSTLEESLLCDLLIHVIDATSPEFLVQKQVVENLLHDLKADDKPIINVYNKTEDIEDLSNLDGICISAKNKTGIDTLLTAIAENLPEKRITIDEIIPYYRGDIVMKIHNLGKVLLEEHLPDGTHIKAIIAEPDWKQINN
ncbi:MAG: GTPase HflX [Clostridiales bacterium]|nr:GTPase HflX [Clostridiales bacterium]